MNQRFHLFVVRLFIFTLIISLLGFMAFYFLPAGYYSPAFPFLLVFFAAVTLIVHKRILKALYKKPSKFVNYFMLTTFIKMFFFLVVMIIYALINREDAIRFIIIYFILYLFYTVFDVISIFQAISRSGPGD
jgi:hypothetical protein